MIVTSVPGLIRTVMGAEPRKYYQDREVIWRKKLSNASPGRWSSPIFNRWYSIAKSDAAPREYQHDLEVSYAVAAADC